jgi:hypothetical protein
LIIALPLILIFRNKKSSIQPKILPFHFFSISSRIFFSVAFSPGS